MQDIYKGNDQETKAAWPTVAVVGLGFIGLPLAMSYARQGCRVIGVDVDERHVARLLEGKTDSVESYEGHTLEHYLQKALANNLFTATTDYSVAAKQADAFIVTVGIPIIHGVPFYDAIDSAADALGRVIKKGDLVLFRSTHIPGTLRDRIIPTLERISHLHMGTDVHVAYAPERVAEGRAMEEFQTVDVLIGGINESSVAHAMEVLRVINQANLHSTSIELAETAKVVENVQRDVNIAMMQEIARFAQLMGLRTSELVKMANTHPRVNLLTPGVGVGGYCLPNAYYYLRAKADEADLALPILAKARETNDEVPRAILRRIEHKLGWGEADWRNRHVAVLGLAMKNFSNDDRISPSVTLAQLLADLGATVGAYDPLVPASHYPFGKETAALCLREAEVVIVTIRQEEWNGWSVHDIVERAPHCKLVFDACEAIQSNEQTAVALLRV